MARPPVSATSCSWCNMSVSCVVGFTLLMDHRFRPLSPLSLSDACAGSARSYAGRQAAAIAPHDSSDRSEPLTSHAMPPASTIMPPFHLAFPVADLAATERFYVDLLGCRIGRQAEKWIDFDFFGHQISAHLRPEET